MADLLQTGSAWLTGVMKSHVATSITYSRGEASVTIADATLGRSEFEVLDQNQMLVKKESQDFIFDVAQLVLDGDTVLPQPGDLIVHDEKTHEVMAPLPRTAPWRYADPPYNQRLRVHTGKVA